MNIEYSGKNLTLRDSLKSKVDAKIDKLQRFTGPILSANAAFEMERHQFKTRLLIHCPRERIYKATAQAEDLFASVSAAVEAIEQQAKKEKGKRLAVRSRSSSIKTAPETEEEQEESHRPEKTKSGRVSHRDDLFHAKPLLLSDAIILLEESESPVLVYEDQDTGRVSVLFEDGKKHYSLVTPPVR